MALTRRKKFGPMQWGMNRMTTVSAVNQVISPAEAIRIPNPGAPSSCFLGSLAHDFERARNLSTPALITQLHECGTQRCA
jgi:hypothetical protein